MKKPRYLLPYFWIVLSVVGMVTEPYLFVTVPSYKMSVSLMIMWFVCLLIWIKEIFNIREKDRLEREFELEIEGFEERIRKLRAKRDSALDELVARGQEDGDYNEARHEQG